SSVRPQEYEVVGFGVLDGDPALHLVFDDGLALSWRFQPDYKWTIRHRRVRCAVAPRAGDSKRPPFGRGPLSLRRKLLLGHPAAVCRALVDQPPRDVCVPRPE